MNIAPVQLARQLLDAARDDLRQLREARAVEAALQRELATYTSPSEVADLLGVLRDEDGPEAQHVRDVLLGNLRPTTSLRSAA